MQKPALVILAAGMGSRFGGLKQMAPVDEYGNLIIDYSIYDALQAGFGRVVCIIKRAIEKDFHEVIGRRIGNRAELRYAFQELDMLPKGYSKPEGREKPWGTSHALLCCKGIIDGPFAVINADDYYGRSAYATIFEYLNAPHARGEYAMVGYQVENTLTDHGAVTRGVCEADENGFLARIKECSGIRKFDDGGVYEEGGHPVVIKKGTLVSMNLWGFDAGLLDELEAGFPPFLNTGLRDNPLKCEYLLPTSVHGLIQSGAASVRVLKSHDKWFGVTYREDMPIVQAAVRTLKTEGVYPERLWD
ncbi:MAG: sugar phosphate nucleotidyltransferase [Bacillota bacterium]